MLEKCENCQSFDNSKFLQNARTRDAGICGKFTEVVFKKETCKWHMPKTDLTETEIFTKPVKPVLKFVQLDFFQ